MFGDVLDGVKKKLEQASKTMDDAAVRSRAIERKLRQVEELPPAAALRVDLAERRISIKKIGDDPARPGIVHRLDKEASGLIVVAKKSKRTILQRY